MDKIIHKVRREQWIKIIKECLASGSNKTVWCREQGISDKSFFYRQRRLSEGAYISTIESSSPPAIKSVSMPAESSVDFVGLRLLEQSAVSSTAFISDVIIRKDASSLEISCFAFTELLSRIGDLLHDE